MIQPSSFWGNQSIVAGKSVSDSRPTAARSRANTTQSLSPMPNRVQAGTFDYAVYAANMADLPLPSLLPPAHDASIGYSEATPTDNEVANHHAANPPVSSGNDAGADTIITKHPVDNLDAERALNRAIHALTVTLRYSMYAAGVPSGKVYNSSMIRFHDDPEVDGLKVRLLNDIARLHCVRGNLRTAAAYLTLHALATTVDPPADAMASLSPVDYDSPVADSPVSSPVSPRQGKKGRKQIPRGSRVLTKLSSRVNLCPVIAVLQQNFCDAGYSVTTLDAVCILHRTLRTLNLTHQRPLCQLLRIFSDDAGQEAGRTALLVELGFCCSSCQEEPGEAHRHLSTALTPDDADSNDSTGRRRTNSTIRSTIANMPPESEKGLLYWQSGCPSVDLAEAYCALAALERLRGDFDAASRCIRYSLDWSTNTEHRTTEHMQQYCSALVCSAGVHFGQENYDRACDMARKTIGHMEGTSGGFTPSDWRLVPSSLPFLKRPPLLVEAYCILVQAADRAKRHDDVLRYGFKLEVYLSNPLIVDCLAPDERHKILKEVHRALAISLKEQQHEAESRRHFRLCLEHASMSVRRQQLADGLSGSMARGLDEREAQHLLLDLQLPETRKLVSAVLSEYKLTDTVVSMWELFPEQLGASREVCDLLVERAQLFLSTPPHKKKSLLEAQDCLLCAVALLSVIAPKVSTPVDKGMLPFERLNVQTLLAETWLQVCRRTTSRRHREMLHQAAFKAAWDVSYALQRIQSKPIELVFLSLRTRTVISQFFVDVGQHRKARRLVDPHDNAEFCEAMAHIENVCVPLVMRGGDAVRLSPRTGCDNSGNSSSSPSREFLRNAGSLRGSFSFYTTDSTSTSFDRVADAPTIVARLLVQYGRAALASNDPVEASSVFNCIAAPVVQGMFRKGSPMPSRHGSPSQSPMMTPRRSPRPTTRETVEERSPPVSARLTADFKPRASYTSLGKRADVGFSSIAACHSLIDPVVVFDALLGTGDVCELLNEVTQFDALNAYSSALPLTAEVPVLAGHEGFVYLNLGNALFNMQQFDKALNFLAQAAELLEKLEVPIEAYRARVRCGDCLVALGKNDEAVTVWKSVAGLSDDCGDGFALHNNLLRVFMTAHNYPEVVVQAQELIEVAKSRQTLMQEIQALIFLGTALLQLGKYDEVLTHVDTLLDIVRNNPETVDQVKVSVWGETPRTSLSLVLLGLNGQVHIGLDEDLQALDVVARWKQEALAEKHWFEACRATTFLGLVLVRCNPREAVEQLELITAIYEHMVDAFKAHNPDVETADVITAATYTSIAAQLLVFLKSETDKEKALVIAIRQHAIQQQQVHLACRRDRDHLPELPSYESILRSPLLAFTSYSAGCPASQGLDAAYVLIAPVCKPENARYATAMCMGGARSGTSVTHKPHGTAPRVPAVPSSAATKGTIGRGAASFKAAQQTQQTNQASQQQSASSASQATTTHLAAFVWSKNSPIKSVLLPRSLERVTSSMDPDLLCSSIFEPIRSKLPARFRRWSGSSGFFLSVMVPSTPQCPSFVAMDSFNLATHLARNRTTIFDSFLSYDNTTTHGGTVVYQTNYDRQLGTSMKCAANTAKKHLHSVACYSNGSTAAALEGLRSRPHWQALVDPLRKDLSTLLLDGHQSILVLEAPVVQSRSNIPDVAGFLLLDGELRVEELVVQRAATSATTPIEQTPTKGTPTRSRAPTPDSGEGLEASQTDVAPSARAVELPLLNGVVNTDLIVLCPMLPRSASHSASASSPAQKQPTGAVGNQAQTLRQAGAPQWAASVSITHASELAAVAQTRDRLLALGAPRVAVFLGHLTPGGATSDHLEFLLDFLQTFDDITTRQSGHGSGYEVRDSMPTGQANSEVDASPSNKAPSLGPATLQAPPVVSAGTPVNAQVTSSAETVGLATDKESPAKHIRSPALPLRQRVVLEGSAASSLVEAQRRSVARKQPAGVWGSVVLYGLP